MVFVRHLRDRTELQQPKFGPSCPRAPGSRYEGYFLKSYIIDSEYRNRALCYIGTWSCFWDCLGPTSCQEWLDSLQHSQSLHDAAGLRMNDFATQLQARCWERGGLKAYRALELCAEAPVVAKS